jgi:hypothetical protein
VFRHVSGGRRGCYGRERGRRHKPGKPPFR